MTNSPPASRWLLVYDDTCGLCEATSRRLVSARLVAAGQRRPFASFDDRTRSELLQAGIRNEVAVLDPVTGTIRTGVDAIAALLGGAGHRRLAGLLGAGPLAGIARFAYRLVARNRRVVAPATADVRIACGCDPEPHAGFRIAFVSLLLGLAGGAYAAAGAVAYPLVAPVASGAVTGLLAAAVGWLPLLALAAAAPGGRGERVAHVAWLAATFGLWLLPLAAIAGLLALRSTPAAAAELAPWALGGSLAGAVFVAARRARRRARVLAWPRWAVPLGAGVVVAAALVAPLPG